MLNKKNKKCFKIVFSKIFQHIWINEVGQMIVKNSLLKQYQNINERGLTMLQSSSCQ